MAQAPTTIQSKVQGPFTFDTDTILVGMVDGDARVFVGNRVTIRGSVEGDFVIDHGAVGILIGTVTGKVTNHGYLIVESGGEVGGTITSRKPAKAEVRAGAIVNGERITSDYVHVT